MFVVGNVIVESFDWIDESDDFWFDNDNDDDDGDDCVDVDDISIFFFNLLFVYDE